MADRHQRDVTEYAHSAADFWIRVSDAHFGISHVPSFHLGHSQRLSYDDYAALTCSQRPASMRGRENGGTVTDFATVVAKDTNLFG
jgi:hypothetical protein